MATHPKAPADPHPRLTGILAAEPDLVDRMFDYLVQTVPALAGSAAEVEDAKSALRAEFGGQKAHVRKHERRAHETAQRVLALFNGRNATEVARELRIGRTTVYRLLKQSGRR